MYSLFTFTFFFELEDLVNDIPYTLSLYHLVTITVCQVFFSFFMLLVIYHFFFTTGSHSYTLWSVFCFTFGWIIVSVFPFSLEILTRKSGCHLPGVSLMDDFSIQPWIILLHFWCMSLHTNYHLGYYNTKVSFMKLVSIPLLLYCIIFNASSVLKGFKMQFTPSWNCMDKFICRTLITAVC